MTETVINKPTVKKDKEINKLFPVFFKLEDLRVLLIGAGNAGLEKLRAIITNAPGTEVHVVAEEISEAFDYYASQYPNVKVLNATYNPGFIDDCDLIIAAVNDVQLAKVIRHDAHSKGKLVNVADKPELCDFYLSSVVTKGNLKIAISTNGKSPTMAKRLKEVFNDLLPEELDDVIDNLQQIRNNLKGDFQTKVHELNKVTESLVAKPMTDAEKYEQYWFL
jgi:siroheme synthase-like protein